MVPVTEWNEWKLPKFKADIYLFIWTPPPHKMQTKEQEYKNHNKNLDCCSCR